VAGATSGRPLRTFEMVGVDTPARCAICWSVMRFGRAFTPHPPAAGTQPCPRLEPMPPRRLRYPLGDTPIESNAQSFTACPPSETGKHEQRQEPAPAVQLVAHSYRARVVAPARRRDSASTAAARAQTPPRDCQGARPRGIGDAGDHTAQGRACCDEPPGADVLDFPGWADRVDYPSAGRSGHGRLPRTNG
jgi:hypothetical protein